MEVDADYKLNIVRHSSLFSVKSLTAGRTICTVHRDNILAESAWQKWFRRFKADNFGPNGKPGFVGSEVGSEGWCTSS